jgi:hypothetical protein
MPSVTPKSEARALLRDLKTRISCLTALATGKQKELYGAPMAHAEQARLDIQGLDNIINQQL